METKKLSLLTGCYSPAQAHEILSKTIKSGLQFNRLENFTSLIRYEGNCEKATNNIHQLSRAQEEIEQLVNIAKAQNLHLHLETTVRISLVEEPVTEQVQVAYPSL